MSGIFISYRREDSAYIAGRLHDRLALHFGADQIFRDIDTIELGTDFVERIEEAVGSCDALVVVIGDQWLAKDSNGDRRIDRSRDFVRLEIAAALKRDILILPVLVEKTEMPSEAELPAPLKQLSRRNALDLTDARWHYEVQKLIDALQNVVTPVGGEQGQPVADPPDAAGIQDRSTPHVSPPPSPPPLPVPPVPPVPQAPSPAGAPRFGPRAMAIAAGVTLAVVLAIVAAVVLVGALGDDGKSSSPSPSPTSISAAPALESIGLTASDVPMGWAANPPVTAYPDTAVTRCVGGTDQRTWPRAASPNFAAPDGSAGVSSAAVRAPTPDAASASFDAVADRYVTCARNNQGNFAFTPGAELRSVEPYDISVPSGVRGTAFRTVIDVPVGGSTIQTNVDSVRLQRGDVIVEMELISNGAPFPADTEDRLIETVARRMG